MIRPTLHRSLPLFLRSLSSTSPPPSLLPSPSPPLSSPLPSPLPSPPSTPTLRSLTPLQTQFETWTTHLKPPFTPSSVLLALRSTTDPDTALDIFRWSSLQRNFRHNHTTYLAAIQISITAKRFHITETLINEILAGACSPSLPLYNTIVKFCTNRRTLFNTAFDVYKKMLKCQDAKPNLETFTLLFTALLRRFNKLHVCYVYLHPVRSLNKQMKALGVIPDVFILNMIIKAFSKCLEVDEAIRVFREMGLYGCEPNNYTYSYLVRGMCEKGRVSQGLGLYTEAKEKCLVVKSSAFMVLICSLAMGRRFEEATEVVFDMLGNGMSPDFLSYRTLFEGMCREGRGDGALELLEEVRKKDTMMNDKTYRSLLNGLHFFNRD